MAVLLALAGCSTQIPPPAAPLRRVTPVIDVGARLAELARLSAEQRQLLCGLAPQWAPVDRQVRMSGPIDRANANSQQFLNALYTRIALYFLSPAEHYAELESLLHEAASALAYTELAPFAPAELPGYNVWNEPTYQQALLLVPVAIGYSIVRKEQPRKADLHAAIQRWGDALFASAASGRDDFIGRYQGLDRLSMKASGFAFWGNATDHREALALAYTGYMTALRSVAASGADRHWALQGVKQLYYANMTWGPMAITARALAHSGFPGAYEATAGGGNLFQAADWLVRAMGDRADPILVTGYGPGSRSVAWLEALVAGNPASPQSTPAIRQALERLG